jgi:hypothetical protein
VVGLEARTRFQIIFCYQIVPSSVDAPS